MYCKKCNLTFGESMKYCSQCGSELWNDLDCLGADALAGKSGAFDKLYWQVEEKVRRYLYHRVPLQELESCAVEAYRKLLSSKENFSAGEYGFSKWFDRFLYRFALQYTSSNNIFLGEENEFYETQYEPEKLDLSFAQDITMNVLKRTPIAKEILEGVSERERICFSLHFLEGLSIDMIALSMHTGASVVEHYLTTANEKMNRNVLLYQQSTGSTLFGMNFLSFIIWILQYDDMIDQVDPKSVLSFVKMEIPEKTDAQYRVIDENPSVRGRKESQAGDKQKVLGMAAAGLAGAAGMAAANHLRNAEDHGRNDGEERRTSEKEQYENNVRDYRNAEKKKHENNMRNLSFHEPKSDEKNQGVTDNAPYNNRQVPYEQSQQPYDDSEEEASTAVKVGNGIIKILIGICIIVLVALIVLIASNLLSTDKADSDLETNNNIQGTAAVETATEEASTEDRIDLDTATKAYKEYMKQEKMDGDYYAVIEAGENKNPILIVAKDSEQNGESEFQPAKEDYGYDLSGIYQIYDDEITAVTNEVTQNQDLGAWRLYKDKLSSYIESDDGSDGIRLLEITDDSYTFAEKTSVPDDYDQDASIIKLTLFGDSSEATTKATTEATTEATTRATTEATTEATTRATTEATTEATTRATTEATTEATIQATTEEEEESVKVNKVVVVSSPDGTLNVREEASADSDIMYTLYNDDEVTIVNQKGNWGELSGGGWINMNYTIGLY